MQTISMHFILIGIHWLQDSRNNPKNSPFLEVFITGETHCSVPHNLNSIAASLRDAAVLCKQMYTPVNETNAKFTTWQKFNHYLFIHKL